MSETYKLLEISLLMNRMIGCNHEWHLCPDAPIQFSCSSGNCNWTQFQSLGVCSSCSNVTANTIQSCYTVRFHIIDSYSCNYTTSSGSELQLNTSQLGYSLETGTLFSINASKPDDGARLVKYAAINLTYIDQQTGGWEATECSLSWCAKTYENTTVVNGTLNLEPSSAVELTAGNVLRDSTGTVTAIQEFVVSQNETNFSGNRSFYINIDGYLTLTLYLIDILTTSRDIVSDVGGASGTGDSNIGVAIYAAGNVTNSSANIATSMTNAIRTTGNSTSTLGQTITSELYIYVHWWWLALPLATFVLATALLVVLILLTERQRGPLWKESALALLFHGLEGLDVDKLDMYTPASMDEAAKSLRVKLRRNDGLKFVLS